MKARSFLPAVVAGIVCLAGWAAFRYEREESEATGPENGIRNPARPPRGGQEETVHAESRMRIRAFAADGDAAPLTRETVEEVHAILTPAIAWSRRELTAAAEEMLAGDLSTPRRTYLFGGLLNLLSAKDGAGALALYDRAWENAGFNLDGEFHVHEMVLNLADHDPARAAGWVEARRDRLPEEMTRILLEKIDWKAPRKDLE